jgi:ribosomal protein S20
VGTAKDEIKSLLAKLPDDCTLEDVQYHLCVLGKIRKGIERAVSEGAISQEEVERGKSQLAAAPDGGEGFLDEFKRTANMNP